MQGKTNHSDYYKRNSNGSITVYSGGGRPSGNAKRTYNKKVGECFAKGTMVWRCHDNDVIETKIEDIKEGDYVLSQHDDGQIRPELVVVKDKHQGESLVYRFTLSNGSHVSCTENHGMLVYLDDCYTSTKRQ